jgi:hypothetical protein
MEGLQNVKTNDIVKSNTENAKSSYKLIVQSTDIHGDGNFLQGCSFSPDGLCILTHTVADAKLRLYNTPLLQSTIPYHHHTNDSSVENLRPAGATEDTTTAPTLQDWTTILTSDCGDSVRCYSWYPLMKSTDPGTCCFIAASRYVE